LRLLLDENLPHDLRHLLVGHEVFTVTYMGWSGVQNGELLARAAEGGFAALITLDSGMEGQRDRKSLPLAVVILRAATNDLDDITPLVPALLAALADLRPGSFTRVG
jgi:predicted nuclease of predicted toxin-antitoxin system